MFRGILPKEDAFYGHFEKLAALNLTISSLFLSMVEGNKSIIESFHEIKKLEREAERMVAYRVFSYRFMLMNKEPISCGQVI